LDKARVSNLDIEVTFKGKININKTVLDTGKFLFYTQAALSTSDQEEENWRIGYYEEI
jgi:hypothetical protein